ncbi:MAG: PHP domain-containing protein, partial [Planctomycetota bacterium]
HFPFTLAYFTGSKEHNIVMRQRTIERGLRLNEYGLFGDDGSSVSCKDETEIYAALGVPHYIAPELREDVGEFAAAEAGTLPELITHEDLRGLFHMHTTASDGRLSLEETCAGMIERGYEYVGITDHSKTAIYANGLSPERLLLQVKEIAEYNAELDGKLHVFAGNEVDILPDGTLDYPDEVLAELDFVIASVHGAFLKDEKRMTERVIRAISNPYVTMLGHPTGRLLLSRDGYPLDVEAVLKAAAEHSVVVEINCSPWRLDLDWRWCRRAKELGVKVSINPDAHKPEGLDDPFFGIGVARKGWLTCADVINTLPLAAMTKWLKDHRKKRAGR